MKARLVSLAATLVLVSLVVGCSPAAPAPTTAPASPTKAAAPTSAAAPTTAAAPTNAAVPATAAPTAAPAPKVDFPQKGRAITFIVPYEAGGGTDSSSRILAARLAKELGVPVEVLNKGGA